MSKHFEIEAGLGYRNNRHRFHFDYFHPSLRTNFKETLNISLHYLQIPVTLSFRQPLDKKTSLLFSGGMRIRGLLYAKDNYQDILFWTVALNGMKYRRVFVVPYTSVSIQKQLFGIHKSEVGIFVSRDIMSMAQKDWGFYENLYPSRILQFGMHLKPFIN